MKTFIIAKYTEKDIINIGTYTSIINAKKKMIDDFLKEAKADFNFSNEDYAILEKKVSEKLKNLDHKTDGFTDVNALNEQYYVDVDKNYIWFYGRDSDFVWKIIEITQ